MWKTASASPPSGGRPRLVADHTHKRTLHKDRKGGGLFLFTHLTVERCPFLIYLLGWEHFGALGLGVQSVTSHPGPGS